MIATRRQRTVAPLVIWLVSVAGSAPGELITFRFEGVVTNVEVTAQLPVQSWPQVGEPFRGTYSFNSTATDSTQDPSSVGYISLSPAGVRVQVGAFDLQGAGTGVGMYDDVAITPPYDLYEAGNSLSRLEFLSHPELGDVLNRNHFQLHLRGDTELLDGVALPLTPPDLANATEAWVSVWLDNGLNTRPYPFVTITGSLDSLTLVPEPKSLYIVGIALCTSRLIWSTRPMRLRGHSHGGEELKGTGDIVSSLDQRLR